MNHAVEGLKSNMRWIVLGVVFAAALVPSLYFHDKYQEVTQQLQDAGKQTPDSAKELEELVGKHMSLPKETPSVARVSDKAALSGQEFFTNAQNGDKVLIYKKAKLAVLYRPSTDKIINAAPIVLDGDVAGESAASPTAALANTKPPLKTFSVAVYNATQKAGYAKTVGNKVTAVNANITLGPLGNAKGDFTEVIVVELAPSARAAAAKIAKDLGGRVTLMPRGEATPEADILVIAGK